MPDLAFTLRITVLCSQYIQLSTSQLSKEEENKAYIVAFLRILLLWNKDYSITKCSPIHFLPQVCQEQAVLSKTPGFLLAPSCSYLTLLAHMAVRAGQYQGSLQVKSPLTFYSDKGSLPWKIRTAPLLVNNMFSADLCSGWIQQGKSCLTQGTKSWESLPVPYCKLNQNSSCR